MVLKDIEGQIEKSVDDLKLSLDHLEYSYKKVQKLGLPNLSDYEALETWESFTSRFSRVSDIFSKKLLRSLILKGDPSFRGSMMDLLNQGEKQSFISDANKWWEIRALRNKEAHEYNSNKSLVSFFEEVFNQADYLISEVKGLLSKL